jgi:hypothetical protein
MVHMWISLRNDRIGSTCQNKRILRIVKHPDVRFYGDYDLDIYLGTKNDYKSLEAVVSTVIDSGYGWIRNCRLERTVPNEKTSLLQYISDCGFMPDKQCMRMFPRREDCKIMKGITLRKDGNFIMYACETTRFYYVICFATS